MVLMNPLGNVLSDPLMDPMEFLPSDLPGLKLWARFNRGITVVGSGVSQWDDASGNGNHLKQATALDRPLIQGDGSLLLDGVRQFIKADAFTLVQPETVILLVNQITWTNQRWLFDGATSATGVIYQVGTTPSNTLFAGTNLAGISPVLGTYNVLTGTLNGVSSVLQLNNDTPVIGDAGAANMGGFVLGSRYDGGGNWSNLQVKEVIVTNTAIDADTRAKIVRYLKSL